MRKKIEQAFLIVFWSIAVLVLIIATIVEQKNGVQYIHQHLYHSTTFLIFNTLLFTYTGYFLYKNVTKQVKSVKFQLFFAFFWILLGAFFTFFNAKEVNFSLKNGSSYPIENLRIQLTNIKVNENEFSNNHSVTIQIGDQERSTTATLSVNKIHRYKGYRFYLTQIHPKRDAIELKVMHNPWGIAFTYIGYAWFLIAFFILVCRKDGRFRYLLRQAATANAILLCLFPQHIFAQRTLSTEAAKEMASTMIWYQGRVAPVETLCDDWLQQTYGKKHYQEFSSVQVVFGWVLFPEDWTHECIFKVGRNNLSSSKYLSLNQLFTSDGVPTELISQNTKLNQSLGELQLLRRGDIWRIAPTSTRWLSPIECADSCNVIAQFFPTLYHAINARDEQSELQAIRALQNFQRSRTTDNVGAELFYNRLFQPLLYGIILITIGIASFILHLIKTEKKQPIKRLPLILRIVGILSFTLLTLIVGLRWYIGKHIPLSNGCETLLFVAWLSLSISITTKNQHLTLKITGYIIAGFSLLSTTFSFNSTAISPLAPALNSSLLSFHVITIMIAYTLLAFTFFISVGALIRLRKQPSDRPTTYTKILLIPTVGLLAFGIILGSLWANISWGSYWSWDAKEVWALITLMLYSAPLCEDFFPIFKREKAFHIFIIVSFCALLMTYFGVNVFFTGMHSYM